MNIKICDLCVTYRNKDNNEIKAVNHIDLQFEEGSFNVIIGYSGCGKTTLLRAIAGLQDYTGRILFDGRDAAEMTMSEKNISLVAQNYVLYPHMTVFDNIATPLNAARTPADETRMRVKEIADELEITHCLTRKPKQLSGGQQQRVALARALVKNPRLCLFDEPLSNLDAPMRNEARRFIKSTVARRGATAVYVTHDIAEAMALATNLIVMHNGKIAICGTPRGVYESGNSIVNSLKSEQNIKW